MIPLRLLAALLLTTLPLLAQSEAELNDLSAGIALGGPDVLQTIRNAETVTAQRIDSTPAENPPRRIIDLGEPFAVTPAQAAALKTAFTTGKTYLSPSKTCQFRANVRYTFATPQDKVSLVLCFGCGELEVWRDKELVSFGPFDGGYSQILDLTKGIFPKDEFLAAFTAQAFQERALRMQVEKPGATPAVVPAQ